jgi:phosphatidylglycerophosphate synthase
MTFYSRREKFRGVSEKIGKAFSRSGISPDEWTFLSLIPAFAAFYFLAKSAFLPAAVSLLAAGFLDMVDGAVARVTGKAGRKGAYLDTVTDRYVEGIIIFGLLFPPLPGLIIPAHGWAFLYLFGSLMTTYSKSAAAEKGLGKIKGGLLERAERLIILFFGVLLAVFDPAFLTYTTALLAVLTNASALQRIAKA